MRPTVLEAPHDLPPSSYDGCISDMSTRDVIACSYGDETAERTLAVVGSSHAEHWLTALDLIGKNRGVRIASYLKMGCPLNLGEPMLGDSPYPDCRDWSADVLDRLRGDRPDWVFSTATRPNPSGPGDVTPDEYLQVWARYADFGLPFLGLRDTPWLHRDGVPYLAIDCLAAGGDAESCGVAREEVLSPENPTMAAAVDFPLVFPIDLSDAVCDATICRAVEGNVLVYNDSHHLSATYVRSLAPELDRQIGVDDGVVARPPRPCARCARTPLRAHPATRGGRAGKRRARALPRRTPGRLRGTRTRRAPGSTVHRTGVGTTKDSPSTPTGTVAVSASITTSVAVRRTSPWSWARYSSPTAWRVVRTEIVDHAEQSAVEPGAAAQAGEVVGAVGVVADQHRLRPVDR